MIVVGRTQLWIASSCVPISTAATHCGGSCGEDLVLRTVLTYLMTWVPINSSRFAMLFATFYLFKISLHVSLIAGDCLSRFLLFLSSTAVLKPDLDTTFWEFKHTGQLRCLWRCNVVGFFIAVFKFRELFRSEWNSRTAAYLSLARCFAIPCPWDKIVNIMQSLF